MSTFTFPSPVGGVSSNDDFAPSILFAVLFGLLVPITVFRYSKENSRTLILFGTFGSSAER